MSPLRRIRIRLRRRRVERDPNTKWFWDHYGYATGELIKFCAEAGLDLHGLEVADIGCGDGILSVGMVHRARPARLVGFDVVPTNVDILLERVKAQRVATTLPAELEFVASEPTRIPADDAQFDFVYSWSAFEHIADPLAVLREIHRVLRPDGCFFLQLWPFYHSQMGSHLWSWYDTDFHHLIESEAEIVAHVRASHRFPDHWTNYMVKEFQELNRITVGDLQAAVLEAGFTVSRLELLSNPVQLQPELDRYPWTDLAVGGVKLLARPRPSSAA